MILADKFSGFIPKQKTIKQLKEEREEPLLDFSKPLPLKITPKQTSFSGLQKPLISKPKEQGSMNLKSMDPWIRNLERE